MTLIETAITVTLLMTVLISLLVFLESSQTHLGQQISRSTSNDQVRLAIESIDREVRSGDVLYDPAAATEVYNPDCAPATTEFPTCGDIKSGMALRIYTENNGTKKCVQWRITRGGELQRRSWAPANPAGTVGSWRIVATGITNRSDNVIAFKRPAANILNLIDVELRANGDPKQVKGSTVDVQQTISGRNTLFYPTSQPCGGTSPAPVSGPNGIPAY